jgi:hypothetical protein
MSRDVPGAGAPVDGALADDAAAGVMTGSGASTASGAVVGGAETGAAAGDGRTAGDAGRWVLRLRGWPPPGHALRWLSIVTVSFGLFVIRFLVPSPVAQADNHDGRRVLCAFGVAPVTGGFPRWVSYSYFQFVPSASCAKFGFYPTSQLVLMAVARVLTPLTGLPGSVNLIALGLLTCAIVSFGIATLATGLRLRPWAQLTVAAAAWLIMADSAFFDLYASPFAEPAALIGLLLVAAGLVYLGRDWPRSLFGLLLAGVGGLFAILAKEQYAVLAVPICLTLLLAGSARGPGRGLRRYLTRQTKAAVAVVAVLAGMTAGYLYWDSTSSYAAALHHEQAVDMIFDDIVNGHDNARADLRALGLPGSWAVYAGHDFWSKLSVRHDPLYARYAGKLSDGTVAHFLLTHPDRIARIGQHAARYALHFRVTYLGDYPPSAGHPPGTVESRVTVLTWLVRHMPTGLGLWWLIVLWAGSIAIAVVALIMRRGSAWRHDGAVVVACMTGCAFVAFIPPAFSEGIATTRHMVGSNLASALAILIAVALAFSLAYQAIRGAVRRLATVTGRRLSTERNSVVAPPP